MASCIIRALHLTTKRVICKFYDGTSVEKIDMVVGDNTYEEPNAFCINKAGQLMIFAEKGESDAILIYDTEAEEFTENFAPGNRTVFKYPVALDGKLCICAHTDGDWSSQAGFSFDGKNWTQYNNVWDSEPTGFANKIYTVDNYYLSVLDLATDKKSYLKYGEQFLKPIFQTTGTSEYYVVDDELYFGTDTSVDEVNGPDANNTASIKASRPDHYRYVLKLNKHGQITKLFGERNIANYWFFTYGFAKYGSHIYFKGRLQQVDKDNVRLYRLEGDSFASIDKTPADLRNFDNLFSNLVTANGALYSFMKGGSKGIDDRVYGWRLPNTATPVETTENDEINLKLSYYSYSGEMICDLDEPGEITIFNINGSKVTSINVHAGSGRYPCQLATSGIYIASFVSRETGREIVEKFIVRKQ
ncbi:MAG: hypothetical protein N4A74_02200 [Carboxylicivirga sp.]|nr:hypothetical protein [Carboxylicivirga sp.]